MSNITKCADCKKVDVYENDSNACTECSKYVNKYYCEICQNNHGCNKGIWESIEDKNSPKLVRLIQGFTSEVLLEVDHIIKELVSENKKLKEKNKELNDKIKELSSNDAEK